MNSLNRTHILPQQTIQGSQAQQQPVIISNNDKGNSEIANNTKQTMPQIWKDDWDWNKNWENPLLDTYVDQEAIPEAFPLWELPDDIQGVIEEVSKITQAPISLIFASCMSVISATVQGIANATYPTINGNRSVPCSLFFLTLADSGERKTTVDTYFKKSITDWEKQTAKQFAQEVQNYKGLKKVWDIKTKNFEKEIHKLNNTNTEFENSMVKHYSNEPIYPTNKKLLIMDATPEAFMKELQSYPSKAQLSSEGGTIFGSNSMNTENLIKTLSQTNELWDGNGINRSRMSEESNISVSQVRVTLGIAIQPSVFQQFMKTSNKMPEGSGYLARFLVSHPISTKGERIISLENFKNKLPTPFLDNFNKRIKQLLEIGIKLDEDKEFQNIDIILSHESSLLWEDFYNRNEEQLCDGGNYNHISGFVSKSSEHLVRLATCLHVFCDKSGQTTINKEIMSSAIELMYWYIREQKRFDNKSTESELLSDLEYILGMIRKHCNKDELIITNSELRPKTKYRVPKFKGKYERILYTLEKLKCIRLFSRCENKNKTLYIALNPKLENL